MADAYDPTQQTPAPAPTGGGGGFLDWLTSLGQGAGNVLSTLGQGALTGAKGLDQLVAHLPLGPLSIWAMIPQVFDERMALARDRNRLFHDTMLYDPHVMGASLAGLDPSSPYGMHPAAPGASLPPDVQQFLYSNLLGGQNMAKGTAFDLSGYQPKFLPSMVPPPVMSSQLAESYAHQGSALANLALANVYGPGGAGGLPETMPGHPNLHLIGGTTDQRGFPHGTYGAPTREPGQGVAPYPKTTGGTTNRVLTSQEQYVDLPASYNATTGVNFPGGKLDQKRGTVVGNDGQQWVLNPDGTLLPAPNQGVGTGGGGAARTPPATPPPAPGAPPAPTGAPGATSAAPPPPATPPAATAAPTGPPPSPADMDAARRRLDERYGHPANQDKVLGQAPPAPAPEPGAAAGAQVGTALAAAPPPPGTAPGAETPPLASRLISSAASALGPSEAAAQEAPPDAQQTKAAKEPGTTFGQISDLILADPAFRDDLVRRYHQMDPSITDVSQIPPDVLTSDKYAVAKGRLYARQLHDEELVRRGQQTQATRAQADRERVQDMENVIHLHYSQVLGYQTDPKTGEQHAVTAMDASSPSFLWSALTPEHAAEPGYIRTLIEKASPRGDLPPYGANYLKQNDPGPAGAAAGRMLASDSLAISVARAFGTSGRINQTELNIIMNKILPNANNTYIGNVHALQSLEGNLKALASGANVADMRSTVGLPALNAQGEAVE